MAAHLHSWTKTKEMKGERLRGISYVNTATPQQVVIYVGLHVPV